MRSIEWWHFQWPWRSPNPVFKSTTLLKSNTSISSCGYLNQYVSSQRIVLVTSYTTYINEVLQVLHSRTDSPSINDVNERTHIRTHALPLCLLNIT